MASQGSQGKAKSRFKKEEGSSGEPRGYGATRKKWATKSLMFFAQMLFAEWSEAELKGNSRPACRAQSELDKE